MWLAVVIVQSRSPVQLYVTPMDCSLLGLSVPHHLLKFAQVHVHCISDAIQQSYPLMPSSAANFSSIRDFSNESAVCIRGPKYRNFSISPSKEYSGLIPLKTDFFDLFAVHFPIPQFEGINSLVLCFLYSPTLTSKHDYW